MGTLDNRLYFPAFFELPEADDPDGNYYAETPYGSLAPKRTWCFFGEIVNDSLSQLPVLGHRVDVRDLVGDIRAVIFFPVGGDFDFNKLRMGSTIFVRYAHRCYFSDLATEAIKIEDLDFVTVIPSTIDSLMTLSNFYFLNRDRCLNCGTAVGFNPVLCTGCNAAGYCAAACRDAHQIHKVHCSLCKEIGHVLSIDFETWTSYVPFRVS